MGGGGGGGLGASMGQKCQEDEGKNDQPRAEEP